MANKYNLNVLVINNGEESAELMSSRIIVICLSRKKAKVHLSMARWIPGLVGHFHHIIVGRKSVLIRRKECP